MSVGPENRRYLLGAVVVSLLLHGLALSIADASLRRDRGRPKDSLPEPISAHLREPPPPVAATTAPPPELTLPDRGRAASPPPQPAPATKPAARRAEAANAAVSRRALEQLAASLLYPVEAVNRGLEGEVLVRLSLDGNGNVLAARVERGSGHAILDQAAVAASRQLRALPNGNAGEVLLPVRFRLD